MNPGGKLSLTVSRPRGKLDFRSLVVGRGGGGGCAFRISGGVGSECDEMLESEADSTVSGGGSAMLDASSSLSSSGASTLMAQKASLSFNVGKISMKGMNSDP